MPPVWTLVVLVALCLWVGYYLFIAFRGVPKDYWERTGKDPRLNPDLSRGFSARRAGGGAGSILRDPHVLFRIFRKVLRLGL
jgi:hypothetical protein